MTNKVRAAINTLDKIKYYLEAIDDTTYTQPIALLSNSSIGQHTRHIIEFFQCLVHQSTTLGVINYDKRQRNKIIEQFSQTAVDSVQEVIDFITSANLNQGLTLEVDYNMDCDDCETVQTTFERELIYNIEHAIHHMAMIKIGLKLVAPKLQIPQDFGVASSTIKFHKTSVKGH